MKNRASLDFRPLYLQIRDQLVNRLAAGEWKPGEALPSETALAAEYGVSQGTLRKAITALEERHLVFRRQGHGTFAARHTPDRSLFQFFHLFGDNGQRQLPDSQVLYCRCGVATKKEENVLELQQRASVTRLYRLRKLNDEAVIAEQITVASELFPNLHRTSLDRLPNTLYEFYETNYGITVATAIERIRAVKATPEEAERMNVAPDEPVLEIDRVALNIARKPVEWRISRCSTRHHHYLNELD